jgi:hypothetical protein
MYKKLKTEHLQARKTKNVERSAAIVGVIAEVDSIVMADKKKAEAKGETFLIMDSIVTAVIKNQIKNINKSIEDIHKLGSATPESMVFTIKTLSEFLPMPVSGDELRLIIQGLGASNIGQAMGALKKLAAEQGFDYDGKEASTLVKNILV